MTVDHYDDHMINMYQLGTVYANAIASGDEKIIKMVQEYMRMKQTWRDDCEQA
jgi:hypothetical protein